MSLLSSTNSGSASVDYFIRNIGGPGNGVADAPVIKGSTLGTVLIGAGAPGSDQGLRLRGDTVASANAILGNQTAGGSLTIGNSVASFQNIVLQDAATTINTDLSVGNLLTPTSGDIILVNGASGASISNYYSAQVAIAGVGAFANPAGLTPGVYLAVYVAPGAGNENAQPSGVFYWSGTTWSGNAVSTNFTAGAPNAVITPVAGGATLSIGQGGAGTCPVPGTVYLRKMLN